MGNDIDCRSELDSELENLDGVAYHSIKLMQLSDSGPRWTVWISGTLDSVVHCIP